MSTLLSKLANKASNFHRRFTTIYISTQCSLISSNKLKLFNLPNNPFVWTPHPPGIISDDNTQKKNINDLSQIPISERPDWVLIGIEDASKVFRLNDNSLQEIPSITKLDPSNDNKEKQWYYLRDVWEKSCEIYGSDVVSQWYNKFKGDVATRVSFTSLYGWNNDTSPTTPLWGWLSQNIIQDEKPETFSEKYQFRVSSHDYNTSSYVVKRAMKANAIKVGLTFSLFLYTHSFTLWAETLHSCADTLNQGLLLIAISFSTQDPNWCHPYGYGSSRWLASFLSGTVLCVMGLKTLASSTHNSFTFFLGTGTSADIPNNLLFALGLCGMTGMLEIYSFSGALKQIRLHLKQQQMSFKQYLSEGTDSTSVHVLLEDFTGMICSVIACSALGAGHYYHPVFDSLGGMLIGFCLSGVGVTLMARNARLLSGRSVAQNILKEVVLVLESCDVVASHHDLKSMILGINTCVIKVEVNFNADKIGDKYVKTRVMFDKFVDVIEKNDIEVFHDLTMKSCADYSQWLIKERSLLENDIRLKVQSYGYERVHVDIENY